MFYYKYRDVNVNVLNVHVLSQDAQNNVDFHSVTEHIFDDRGSSVYFKDEYYYK